ncbi:hypothetical protein CRG98_035830 [Punica granatum]|uniref:Uncharacterized protein n=1 Tax=Punica granatum TaxID=22663 RepID=A0A2I0IIH8_PUNGR|nr:hypothetical protein CRG98_035830 [Punica granatum]
MPEPRDAAAKSRMCQSLQSQFLHFHHNRMYSSSLSELQFNDRLQFQFPNPMLILSRGFAISELHQGDSADQCKAAGDLSGELHGAARQFGLGAQYEYFWIEWMNFHRFVAALMNRSTEDEFKYPENLIENDDVDYSAWHNRSSWFYYLWLLEQIIQSEAPLLVSSWPPNGADLSVSGNRCLGAASSLFSRFSIDLRRFPVVLYFNQNVEGIDSSTVTAEASIVTSKDLTWKLLSPKNSQFGGVWVAYRDISSVGLDSLSPQRVQNTLKGMIMRNFHGKKMTFVTPKDSWKNQVLLRFGVAYRYRDGTDKSLSGPCWELGLVKPVTEWNRGSATPFLLEPAQQQTGKFLCSGAPEITQVSESAEHLVQRDRLPPYRHQSLSVHVSSDILRRHEDLPNGVDVENYWAAFMVFKDLDLVQLDVAEIPVANEKLQSFLVRIFPALTWLDGRNLH